MIRRGIFSCILLLVSFAAICQDDQRRFFLRPVFGIQGAQIDGDYYAGYNQPGIFAGMFAGRNVSEKTALSFALAFSQKGARKNANPNKGDFDYYRARLNYVELPLQVAYRMKKIDVYFGLYYGRLISSKEENQNGIINTGILYKPNDYGYLFGAEWNFLKSMTGGSDMRMGVRFAYSLVPVRDYFFNGAIYYYNIIQRVFNRGLYNNTLTFYINYNINPGKKSE